MKLIKIGKVLKPHGYKGSFTVSNPEGKNSALKTATTLYIGSSEKEVKPFSIMEAAWMPKAWKITVEGFTTEEQAESLRDQLVFLNREALPKPKTNEYYVTDLVGLEGIDSVSLKSIGTFKELEEIGIAGTAIVQHTWCFEKDSNILKIPAVPHFVVSVDLKNKKVFLKNLNELEEA